MCALKVRFACGVKWRDDPAVRGAARFGGVGSSGAAGTFTCSRKRSGLKVAAVHRACLAVWPALQALTENGIQSSESAHPASMLGCLSTAKKSVHTARVLGGGSEGCRCAPFVGVPCAFGARHRTHFVAAWPERYVLDSSSPARRTSEKPPWILDTDRPTCEFGMVWAGQWRVLASQRLPPCPYEVLQPDSRVSLRQKESVQLDPPSVFWAAPQQCCTHCHQPSHHALGGGTGARAHRHAARRKST